MQQLTIVVWLYLFFYSKDENQFLVTVYMGFIFVAICAITLLKLYI